MAAATLKIECIGDNWGLPPEKVSLVNMFLGGIPKNYWVAEIIGYSDKYRYERLFLRCKKDYTHANSKGTRGVYAYYVLYDDRVYEVKERVSWGKCDRYFCTVRDGIVVRISEEEVKQWLNNRLESMSTGQQKSA